MLAPKVVCSWVCLNRLFSTTLATASRLSVMTMRMPMRSELSSWIAADAADLAVLDQRGDRLDEVVGVDLVGQLGDDQDRRALLVLLDLDDRAHADRAAAGAVGVLDAVAADDQRRGSGSPGRG